MKKTVTPEYFHFNTKKMKIMACYLTISLTYFGFTYVHILIFSHAKIRKHCYVDANLDKTLNHLSLVKSIVFLTDCNAGTAKYSLFISIIHTSTLTQASVGL